MNRYAPLWATPMMLLLTHAEAATVAEQCVSDLAGIPSFLLANDAGAKDELSHWGQPHFDAAFSQARIEANHAQDAAACNSALNAYLKTGGRATCASVTYRERAHDPKPKVNKARRQVPSHPHPLLRCYPSRQHC
jgi:hypothetical protein